MSAKNAKPSAAQHSATIARNRRASHDYALTERFEAGLVLQGWEVKAIRAGKAQLVDSYVLLRDGEAWLLGANIAPLPSASSHVVADPQRTRKLLLHSRELARIFTAIQAKGFSCVATCDVLEAQPSEMRDRPRQGQEAARQARRGAGPGLAAAESANPQAGTSRKLAPTLILAG